MLTPESLRSWFDKAHTFDAYVAAGKPDQVSRWNTINQHISMTKDQTALLASFTRDMPVLVISGLWCGDCAQQVPMLNHIAAANPRIQLRIIDRDVAIDLSNQVKICGGNRVPTVLFLNEEFDLVALRGDCSISRMRAKAATQLGPACFLPGAPIAADELAATITDWVTDFEHAQLICRLSSKLRGKHGD